MCVKGQIYDMRSPFLIGKIKTVKGASSQLLYYLFPSLVGKVKNL